METKLKDAAASPMLWGNSPPVKEPPVEFIIGVDENGNERMHSPKIEGVFFPTLGISNHPIFVDFDKRVLDKYYHDTEAYTVWPMSLVCNNTWTLPMDSYHADKVTVLLPYLDDLPYEEQLHWRAHNIPPNGGVSEEYYEIYIKSSAYDNPEQPKHWFREAYYRLRSKCYEYLGWQLLLPPHPDEEHYIANLTVPAPDEQRDFDALITSLCTLCIDSLNVKALKKTVPPELQQELAEKGTLDCFFDILLYRGESLGFYGCFLRELHQLRCSRAEQRKACNYRQIASNFGYDNRNVQTVFQGMLSQAINLIGYYTTCVECRYISEETLEQREQRYEQRRKRAVEAAQQLLQTNRAEANLPEGTTHGSINHDVYE